LIRRATVDQAGALTSRCRGGSGHRGRFAQAVATVEVTPAYLAEHLVFVAVERTGALLGHYALIRDPAELDMLFVADAAQGRGIGRALVGHLLDQARQSGSSTVRVVSHPPAEPFYLRMGARRTGTVPADPPLSTWERPELRFEVSAARPPTGR
jgi:predicted N-acetyltransferase YhbS